jgi:hypothetical protein
VLLFWIAYLPLLIQIILIMEPTHKNQSGRDSEVAENASSPNQLPNLNTKIDKADEVESSEPSPSAEKAVDGPLASKEKKDEIVPPGQKPPPPEVLERSTLKTAIIMFALCVSLKIDPY